MEFVHDTGMIRNRVVVLYGSETGTAEDVAYNLYESLRDGGAVSVISAVDEFNISLIHNEETVIFIVSTTGDGETPTNMSISWKFLLQKSLSSTFLQNTKFAIFGLGDSSYDKRLSARLKQLGGIPLLALALGDDQARFGYATTFDPWKKEILSLLCPDNTPHVSRKPVCRYTIEQTMAPPSGERNYTSSTTPFCTKVLENTRLSTPTWHQDLRHIRLSCAVKYDPGAVAVVYPANPPEFVSQALAMYTSAPTTLRIASHHSRSSRICSMVVTLHDLFTYYLDIAGVPQRSFFQCLALHTTDDEEREKLIEISSAEGIDLYYDYCLREKRNYIEIMRDFPHCHVPLEYLLYYIPQLPPRKYSISSSSLAHPDEVHLCVAVVMKVTPYKRRVYGVCSRFLRDLAVDEDVYISIVPGVFPVPSITSPLLLIGPGTGVAPMRSMIHERVARAQGSGGGIRLFYGCRSENDDCMFTEEWRKLEKSSNVHIHVAFSRQGTNAGRYVTHDIRDNGLAVWSMLQSSNSIIMIAGSAKKMPQDVIKALASIIQEYGEVSNQDAVSFVNNLQRQKRLFIECWS